MGAVSGPEVEKADPCRVLLLEDNSSDARLVSALLRRSRAEAVITHCVTISDALDHRSSDFDVVLTDLNLPDSSGAETVSQLATVFTGVPIIALTTDAALGLECIAVGAQDFIPKLELKAEALGRAVGFSIGRAKQMRQTEYASRHDSLTGLLNRASFQEAARSLLSQPGPQKFPFIVFVDVNRFKAINDTYGHAVGDMVLISIADQLTDAVRTSDVVCRWGGDEFTVFGLADSHTSAAELAHRLRDQLRTFHKVDASEAPSPASFVVTVSVGHSVEDPLETHTLEQLISDADSDMYEDKARSGDSEFGGKVPGPRGQKVEH